MTTRAPVRSATMHAAVVSAPGVGSVVEVPVPEPGDAEVLVRVEGCGVCASSLPVWEGRSWFRYPLAAGAPGHEGWGVEVASGRRVAFLGEHAFAGYAAVREGDVVPLPEDLDALPFPGEALACGVNVFRRARVEAGQRVAVVGIGFLGSVVAQLGERSGADVVRVRRATGVAGLEESFERVVEAAGTQEALDTASALVAPRGLLVVAGYHQDGPRRVDMRSWNWRGIDVVNAHERDAAAYVDGMREAARLAAEGELDVEAVVTHRFPLERLGEAFEAARRRPPGFVKAWVAP